MIKTIDYLPIISNMFNFFIQIKNGCGDMPGLEDYIYNNRLKTINVCVDDSDTHIFQKDAPITSKGISISRAIKNWIVEKYIYSYVRYKSNVKLEYKKDYVTKMVKYINNGCKSDFDPTKYTIEILELKINTDTNTLILYPFHVITIENADLYLNTNDYKIMMQYLFTNINSLRMTPTDDKIDKLNKHISLFAENGASKWMSAEEYAKRDIQNLGMYNLRKKISDDVRRYYTGKAINISERTVASGNKTNGYTVGHKNDEQFDEVRYDILDFKQLIDIVTLYIEMNKNASEIQKKANYTQLSDSILYGIEGVINHTVRMILEEEKSEATNISFDGATKTATKN